jgi:hypothetical protein
MYWRPALTHIADKHGNTKAQISSVHPCFSTFRANLPSTSNQTRVCILLHSIKHQNRIPCSLQGSRREVWRRVWTPGFKKGEVSGVRSHKWRIMLTNVTWLGAGGARRDPCFIWLCAIMIVATAQTSRRFKVYVYFQHNTASKQLSANDSRNSCDTPAWG